MQPTNHALEYQEEQDTLLLGSHCYTVAFKKQSGFIRPNRLSKLMLEVVGVFYYPRKSITTSDQ